MSPNNLGILRQALPEGGPANLPALLDILDQDVEWDYVGAFPEGLTTYRGPEEVREFLANWAQAFDDFGFEAEEAIEAGDCVVIRLHQWGRGKETGAEVQSRSWQVFTFRDGKVVHCRGYTTKSEALQAAGNSDN
jgi:ketosteroid isomerase-like protein